MSHHDDTTDRASWIARHAKQLLGIDDAVCLFINGWRMDFSSLTALVFKREQAVPLFVAKLGLRDGHELFSEHQNLQLLARSESPQFRRSVPEVLAFGETADAVYLFQSIVPGIPVRLPANATQFNLLADRVVDWMIDFHRVTAIRDPPATATEHDGALLAPLRDFRRRFDVAPAEAALLDRTEETLRTLVGTAFPLVRLHNDFSPSNVLLDGGQIGVIDWGSPLRRAPPIYDLIHLFPCLAAESGRRDGLRVFQYCFFERNLTSCAIKRALERYMNGLGLSTALLRPLFALYWIDYALEKLDNLEAIANSRTGGSAGSLPVWGLAAIEQRTYLNLRLLAAAEDRLQLT